MIKQNKIDHNSVYKQIKHNEKNIINLITKKKPSEKLLFISMVFIFREFVIQQFKY